MARVKNIATHYMPRAMKQMSTLFLAKQVVERRAYSINEA
jgi:hypothetical protein